MSVEKGQRLALTPSRLAPWSYRMYTLLTSDGGWHHHEEIIAIMAPLVPPARATRTTLQWRESSESYRRKKGRTPADKPSPLLQDPVLTGQRCIAGHALGGFVRRGRVERKYDDVGGRWYRWIGELPPTSP